MRGRGGKISCTGRLSIHTEVLGVMDAEIRKGERGWGPIAKGYTLEKAQNDVCKVPLAYWGEKKGTMWGPGRMSIISPSYEASKPGVPDSFIGRTEK